jgi:hypothetical protein
MSNRFGKASAALGRHLAEYADVVNGLDQQEQ